jgi:hypothetical protein
MSYPPWRVKRETGEKGATGEIRNLKFEVSETSNFGPRTVVRLTHLARPAFPARRALA